MSNFMKFVRSKPSAVIKAQCAAQGVDYDDRHYRTSGSDYVTLRSPGAVVMFNTFNGRFHGTTPDGVTFSSDDKRDGTPWFDALLRFFYVEAK